MEYSLSANSRFATVHIPTGAFVHVQVIRKSVDILKLVSSYIYIYISHIYIVYTYMSSKVHS